MNNTFCWVAVGFLQMLYYEKAIITLKIKKERYIHLKQEFRENSK